MSDREQHRLKQKLDVIRRQPENKRCADCQAVSVPYVNMTHGTFVCTRCAGLHREFGHSVKGISVSTFKPADIEAIRGNAVDQQTYLPYWNEAVYKKAGPGQEETERAREFIRLKYEEKRWVSPPASGPSVTAASTLKC